MINKELEGSQLDRQLMYINMCREKVNQLSNELKRPLKCCVQTFGCQMNARDSEKLLGILQEIGYEPTESEEADIVVYNTCTVRENANLRVYGRLGQLRGLKRKNPHMIIALCGCMMQEKEVVEKIQKSYSFVDVVFGTYNIFQLAELLFHHWESDKMVIDIWDSQKQVVEELPTVRKFPFKSGVNIMYGCDKFCTYCIVPYTRGKERSRKMEDILKECKELVDANYQEITLLGQNVDSYGNDLNDGSTFAKLLEEVAKLGIPRLRFLTSYPSDFKDDVIDVIKKYPNIMKYLHLPIQSGSDEVLKMMGRRYDSKQYLELVNRIKTKIPEMAFSTDIIVGFPNETYEQFLDTIKVSNIVEYTSAFTFIYSPRKGTPAARLKDNVTYEEKVKRFKELVKALEVSFEKKANEMVGKTYSCLVEGPSKKNSDILSGYTENMKTVLFKGDNCLIGKIVKVKILESHLYSLVGEIVYE